jgi:hypothetical protein
MKKLIVLFLVVASLFVPFQAIALTGSKLAVTTINDIGVAGKLGFGVGICPPANLPSGMILMPGGYYPGSDNYGNYQFTDGSVMVYVPKFYYKVGTGTNGLAVNVVDIKGTRTYTSTVAANAAGYALHRAFIDGGSERVGFFIDKYKISKNALGTGFVGSSIKNGLPISTAATHNQAADLTGGANCYYSLIDLAHRRDGVNGLVNASSIFHCASQFQRAVLAILSLAHGQASSSTAYCAWYDATYNFPKGCNNNALRDTNDTSVLYVTDGYSNCGKTGSGSLFAKTTHNGQNCGVADLNGLMYEVSIGVSSIAASKNITGATQANPCQITIANHGYSTGTIISVSGIVGMTELNGRIYALTVVDANNFTLNEVNSTGYTAYTSGGTCTIGTFYAAKQATAMKNFTSGNSGATDHWGATGVAAMMDAFAPVLKTANGASFAQCFGSGSNQVLSEAVSGADWLLTGLGMPRNSSAIDTTGTNLFGKDYYYQTIVNDLCLLASVGWSSGAAAGVWGLAWDAGRTYSGHGGGGRFACYPN